MAAISDIRYEAGFAARMIETVKSLAARYEQRKIYRSTLNELQNLSARELADIGISRSMVRSIAYEAAYGLK